MQFTDIFIKRPVLSIVVSLVILFFGMRAINMLEVRQFPKMQKSVITVSTGYPGAGADLIQGFVTSPLEKAIASAEGIDYITSDSTDSMSSISAFIRLNYDPNLAMTDIMAKVSQVISQLPRESDHPMILKSAGSRTHLMYLGYHSTKMSNEQITEYISRMVLPKLQTVSGVANAEVLGGKNYAMRIWLNAKKMAALKITPQEIASALQKQNFQTAAGRTEGKYVVFNITAKTNLSSEEQFNQVVIKNIDGTFIRLRDIGIAKYGSEHYDSSVKFNGKNGVFVGIQSTPTANPLTVIENIKNILPTLQSSYPPLLESTIIYDSTKYISSAIHEVLSSIIEATLIVVLVIFAFIGALRAVTIPIITIPLSLIGATSLMYWMGYSLNLLTLLAMVIAIGLVVDDAIVMVENIYRHLESGLSPFEASKKGAREMISPIISMTLTLAAVYAPIGFMSGLTGALFKEFAFTLSLSVILSGVIALTLSPMMCSKLLNKKMMEGKLVAFIDNIFNKLKYYYTAKLHKILKQTHTTALFAGILLVGAVAMAMTTQTELAPAEDQSILFLSLTAPKYANLQYTEKFTDELSKIFSTIPEIHNHFIINGMGAMNNAIAGAILKPWNERTKNQNKILQEVQPKISTIAGLKAVAFPLPSLPSSGGGLPLQFVLTTTDGFPIINEVMQKLQAAAMKSGLFLFVDSDLKFEKPTLDININSDKASSMGISMENIGSALSIILGGNFINRLNIEGQSYLVIPQIEQDDRSNPEKINDYYLNAPNGESVPLSSLVSLKMSTSANVLHHFQQLNSATLSGLMMPGKSITEGLNFLRQEAKHILPASFNYDFSGESRQAVNEGYTILYTFIFAIIIIYLVLAAQFESFFDPLIILISVPLSMIGALLPLHVGLASLNIYTGIGLVTLIGLISKHGILMVNFANHLQLQENLSKYDAIIKSSALRLRPILMTTVAMVLGVLPLLLANGAGATSRFNIGLVITFGMLIGTLFTLFIVPSMYLLLGKNMNTALSKGNCTAETILLNTQPAISPAE